MCVLRDQKFRQDLAQPRRQIPPVLHAVKTMSNRDSRVFGQKYSCPGCNSLLKFRRPPRTLVQTCPNCRRILRLREKAAESKKDDQLKEALDALAEWTEPDETPYQYYADPKLDEMDKSTPGIWKFDQPWPPDTQQIVAENVEVIFNPLDVQANMRWRVRLLKGFHRRVTIHRTGEVEEIEVDGLWWDGHNGQPQERKLGLLSRAQVRELNRLTYAKNFASRINQLRKTIRDNQAILELYIDIAIAPAPDPQSRRYRPIR